MVKEKLWVENYAARESQKQIKNVHSFSQCHAFKFEPWFFNNVPLHALYIAIKIDSIQDALWDLCGPIIH